MADPYDPNSESTNAERVTAAFWECLRRNSEFRSISKRWVKSGRFRRRHALSAEYYNLQHHIPRCAWDWMLTSAERAELAEFQIQKHKWFPTPDYNFGLILQEKASLAACFGNRDWSAIFRVAGLPQSVLPITVDCAWNQTPELFKAQFSIAYSSPQEFGEINARLEKVSKDLSRFIAKLVGKNALAANPDVVESLVALGLELNELANLNKVFKIPWAPYSRRQFENNLDRIRESFEQANMIVPTKRYDLRQSFLGTAEDWHWFLTAEQLHLDVRGSSDARKLAVRYSESVRERSIKGKLPRRANAGGLRGTQFPARLLKNRRNTVKRHVLAIEKWIRAAYPRPVFRGVLPSI